MRWAVPDFDDSHWSLLRSDAPWGLQGFKGHSGFGWYRFRIKQIPNTRLSLLLPGFLSYYRLFVNGQFVAESGSLPPENVFASRWVVHPIPTVSGPDLSIAIRVWSHPFWTHIGGGGPEAQGAALGTPSLIGGLYRAQQSQLAASNANSYAIDIVTVLLVLTMLSLFLFTGLREYEYLWYGLFRLLVLIESITYLYGQFVSTSYRLYWTTDVIGNISTIFEFLFLARILEAPRNWLYWLVVARIAAVILVSASGVNSSPFDYCAMVVYYVWIFWATLRGARRGLLDARLVMFPLFILCFEIALYRINNLPGQQEWTARVIALLSREVGFGPIQVSFALINGLLVLFSIWALLIARFVRTRREEQEHANDLVAARAVQQMLIPDEIPSIPGFSIASVYKPAQQVGGDFFQIVPLANGALIAVGDVSGKGLSAAMTVSLVVGSFRTLAEQTESPATILEGPNRRLVGSSSGFTTCLIVHLRSDGTGTLANAGHLPPYCSGQEVDTISNLPIGLSSETVYAESPFTLRANDCLTLLSDGVVEARNYKGELFGFDRTRRNSTQPAEALAKTATDFGQEDDITVLTVTYLAPSLTY